MSATLEIQSGNFTKFLSKIKHLLLKIPFNRLKVSTGLFFKLILTFIIKRILQKFNNINKKKITKIKIMKLNICIYFGKQKIEMQYVRHPLPLPLSVVFLHAGAMFNIPLIKSTISCL